MKAEFANMRTEMRTFIQEGVRSMQRKRKKQVIEIMRKREQ